MIYTPGNHDAFFRDYPVHVEGLRIVNEAVHETADGRRLLITHGDRYDGRRHDQRRWIHLVGEFGYDTLFEVDRRMQAVGRPLGWQPTPLLTHVKRHVRAAREFINRFEQSVIDHAARQGFDGVDCGHIHAPAVYRNAEDILYANCGDFLENATAIAESHDGRFQLINLDAPDVASPTRVDDLLVPT